MVPGPMHILHKVYFRFRQHCETADETHSREASLPVNPRSWGRLSNTKGGPLYCPYSCLPQPREGFVVDTDASNIGTGVLPQVKEGQERVIVYYSSDAEKGREKLLRRLAGTTGHRECAGIFPLSTSMDKQFHVHTDHSTLTCLLSFKNLEGQIARWSLRLQEIQLHFQAPSRPKTQYRCRFTTTMPRKVYPLPQSRGAVRRQASRSYCCCIHSRLGSSHSTNGKLNDKNIGPILEETETGQCME
jgi:hypothetical protein